MLSLIIYSPQHGTRVKARVPTTTLTFNPKQVKRLETILRQPLDACLITASDGWKYLVDYETTIGQVIIRRDT